MKADKLHISPFDFLTIQQLEIERSIGEHATATICGFIADDDAEDYRWRLLEKIWVSITAEDESGESKILFTGIIAGFTFEPQPHAVLLTLVLKSGTHLMDRTVHFRSFQNTGVVYKDVLNHINAYYSEAGVMAESCLETTPVDYLLQYRETDWAFIRRIASHFGLMVTPAIVREGAFYYVGNANYATYMLPDTAKFSIGKNVEQFMSRGANGSDSLLEQDYMEYKITLRDMYDLWDILRIKNEGGYICRIHSEYHRGELIHTYHLCQARGMGTMRIFNQCQAGCSFQAVVTEVKADMVKIALTGDENGGQEISRWFPYSTGYSSPDGPGWYCMPEGGDQVRLQIPDGMEEHGYVISSVHIKTGNDRKNPDHKSFKTKYGKELLFTPDSLELTNNQGMSIKIIDKEGIHIKSCKDISISAGGQLTLSSEDSSLVIAGTESVDIRQGSAGLHMETDVIFTGGKFRIQ